MPEVKFYGETDDSLLKYAVVIARTGGRWVFCKHRERDTWEVPGGHREAGESIGDAARRELSEETGTKEYTIRPVCAYSVTVPDSRNGDAEETYGMLFCAEIASFEEELHHEIERIRITDRLPEAWTYPLIQPKLIEEAERRGCL